MGEQIKVLRDDQEYDDGWYYGENQAGCQGLFPINFTLDYPLLKVKDWSVEQVAVWLNNVGFQEWAKEFEQNEITGDVLIELGLAGLRELGIESLSMRIDLYRKIMILKEDLDSPIEDSNSDYAVDIYNDYQDLNRGSRDFKEQENINRSFNSNTSEGESPRTLVTLDSVFSDDFNQTHRPLKLELEVEGAREEEVKDDETLKEEGDARNGLSEALARKWSQLTREYEDTFKLDESVQDSHPDMEGWLYFKMDHRGWKKRFAVLVHQYLYIFKDELVFFLIFNRKKRYLVTSITLSEYKVSPSSSSRQYSFQLVHSESHSLYLAASSQASMLMWINRLVKSGLGMNISFNILEKRKPMLLVPLKQGKYKPLPSIPQTGLDADIV